MDNSDRRAAPAMPDSPRGAVTIALTVRQIALVALAVAVLLAVLVQGRRWRAR